jgi:phage gpG-like protein
VGVVVYDRRAIHDLIGSPRGAVARDLLRRGRAVEARAKIGAPVDTGRLRSSITHQLVTDARGMAVRVGTNVDYARGVHEGTGIYGPRGRPIRPVRAKVLRWRSKRSKSGFVFAREVRGVPGRPFLRNALPAALR